MWKSNYSKTLLGVIGYYMLLPLVQIGVSALAASIYVAVTGDRGDGLTAFLSEGGMGLLLVANLVCIGVIYLMARLHKASFMSYSGIRGKLRMPSMYALCGVLGLSSSVWATFVLSMLPLPVGSMERYSDSMSLVGAGPLALELLTVVLAAPMVEELLFRGLIFDRLRRMMPTGLAAVFQALLFGSLHGDLVWVVYAAVFGCVLCYVRCMTNTVRASIIVHVFFNGASYLFSGLLAQFITTYTALFFTLCLSAGFFIWSVSGINKRRNHYRITP